jgi:hypothetical protein
VAKEFLPRIGEIYAAKGVEMRCDPQARDILGAVKGASLKDATEQDWYEEYLAPVISIKVVGGIDEAIEHINRYGSHHTDAIITRDHMNAQRFLREVDSASVMVNASPRFADGFEYGLGAEIGISTDKFHPRGPVGIEGLTSLKWIVLGQGSALLTVLMADRQFPSPTDPTRCTTTGATGYNLLDKTPDGHLVVTDDFLRSLLERPGPRPWPNRAKAKSRCTRRLLAQPRAELDVQQLAALSDDDARSNYGIWLRFRQRLLAHPRWRPTWPVPGRGVDVPPVFVRSSRRSCCAIRWAVRLGPCRCRRETLFRPQRISVQEDGQVMAADEETVERRHLRQLRGYRRAAEARRCRIAHGGAGRAARRQRRRLLGTRPKPRPGREPQSRATCARSTVPGARGLGTALPRNSGARRGRAQHR